MPSTITLFCDDIRREEGGQISCIGIYQQALIAINPFPMVIPKLCLSIFFTHYVGEKIKLPVVAKVRFAQTDAILFQSPLPLDEMLKTAPKNDELGNPITMLTTRFDLTFSPLIVKVPSVLEVFVAIGDKDMESGSLEIRSSAIPEPDAASDSKP
jgi:hypothetical protein